MMTEPLPCFLDFEASSASLEHSYPIEVAWNDLDGEIYSTLINPDDCHTWTDWNPRSAILHGLSRQQLSLYGILPEAVITQLTPVLRQNLVYTDAPKYDNFWLSRLYKTEHRSPPSVLQDIQPLLRSQLHTSISDPQECEQLLTHLHYLAGANTERRHRAKWDVQYLINLWRLVQDVRHNAAHAIAI